ncbi:MAG: hypothetical protein ACI90A_001628, partial [Shewanella sp.]
FKIIVNFFIEQSDQTPSLLTSVTVGVYLVCNMFIF